MKIYLDLIMILNFFFDFILLLSVSIILRRNADIYRLMLGSFIGGLSIILLFININSLELFLYKIIISILMVLISFKYINIKYTIKNLLYFYSSSIILGGFLYFLNIQFSYKNNGLIFYNNGLSINVIILIILSPLIIYLYIKQGLWLKNNYSNYYKVKLFYNNKIINLNGYLDTGNTLKSPFSNKPIILITKKIECLNYFYLPYKTISNVGILKCFKADIEIKNVKYHIIVGLLDKKINLDGVDCLLNRKIMEEI